MENIPQKFDIISKQDNSELKIYMFTVQKGLVNVTVPEDFRAILAYTDNDAISEVAKFYPAGTNLQVSKRAQVEVKKIVDVLNLEVGQPIVQPIVEEKKPEPKKTAENFINGLMLVVEEFVKDKKDQVSLKKIINKIKINEDGSSTSQ